MKTSAPLSLPRLLRRPMERFAREGILDERADRTPLDGLPKDVMGLRLALSALEFSSLDGQADTDQAFIRPGYVEATAHGLERLCKRDEWFQDISAARGEIKGPAENPSRTLIEMERAGARCYLEILCSEGADYLRSLHVTIQGDRASLEAHHIPKRGAGYRETWSLNL